jgi:hypothetical protein
VAITFTLIATTKVTNVDPQAWLTSAPAQIVDHRIALLGVISWAYSAIQFKF